MAESEKNILIVDSGSRGHALADTFRRNSPEVRDIFIAPGNAGTEFVEGAGNLNVDINNHSQVVEAVRDNNIEWVVIAPEAPLVNGIVDVLRSSGIETFGPTKKAARIEGEKSYAMWLLNKYGIQTPRYEVADNPEEAHLFIDHLPDWGRCGLAVKAEELAGGKGVIMTHTLDEAHEAVRVIMEEKKFGDAGNRVVFQERLVGYEVSPMAVVDGRYNVIYPTAEDYKQEFDDDLGRNTGGKGACAPHPMISKRELDEIEILVIKPIVRAMAQEGLDFNGILYPAIFMTEDGPKVIEVNVRLGGSEWEALTRLIDFDLFKAFRGYSVKHDFKEGFAISVALTASGYPGDYERGQKIEGLDKNYENVVVYHAGTKKDENGNFLTNGGRVVFVTAHGENVDDARQKAYDAIGNNGIHFEGMHFRTDIGARVR